MKESVTVTFSVRAEPDQARSWLSNALENILKHFKLKWFNFLFHLDSIVTQIPMSKAFSVKGKVSKVLEDNKYQVKVKFQCMALKKMWYAQAGHNSSLSEWPWADGQPMIYSTTCRNHDLYKARTYLSTIFLSSSCQGYFSWNLHVLSIIISQVINHVINCLFIHDW